MSITSIFKAIGDWLKDKFTHIKNDGAKVAISVTEGLKKALQSGVLDGIASIIDHIAGGSIADTVVDLLKANINKILSVELGLQGLPDDPSEDDLKAFTDSVIDAFTSLDKQGKSKLYTTLAAQIYGILKADLEDDGEITFASLVKDIEDAYQDYLKDVAEAA